MWRKRQHYLFSTTPEGEALTVSRHMVSCHWTVAAASASVAAKLAWALGVSLDVLANTYGDALQQDETDKSELLPAAVALVGA